MKLFEEAFMYCFHKQHFLHLWYLDNVLLLWRHEENPLTIFKPCYHLSWIYKFVFHYLKETVNFLELISGPKLRTLAIHLFRKPTDKYQILDYTSHYPKSKTNHTVQQFLRLRRIWSGNDAFSKRALSLHNRLLERKCTERLIIDAEQSHKHLPRWSFNAKDGA